MYNVSGPSYTNSMIHAVNGGIIISLVGHGIFSFLPRAAFVPYLAMSLMGISYSVVGCVLWPLVVFNIPDYQLGTAYGM